VPVSIQVSDRVILHERHVYAETNKHVFRRREPNTLAVLRCGDLVRESARINLRDWECFPRHNLPPAYVQATAIE